MKKITMQLKRREATGKRHGRAVRRQGLVPAVLYGADGPNASVSVEEKELRAALREGAAQAILDLELESEDGGTLAIIKEIQYDALGDDIQHVDFYRITEGKPIQVTIPLTATGHSIGEKEGGVVEYLTREVRVECLPRDIPEEIAYDVEPLDVGDSLHLQEVAAPPGVTFIDSLDTALVVVKAPRMAAAEVEVPVEAEVAEGEEAAEGEAPEGEGAAEGEETPSPEGGETS